MISYYSRCIDNLKISFFLEKIRMSRNNLLEVNERMLWELQKINKKLSRARIIINIY